MQRYARYEFVLVCFSSLHCPTAREDPLVLAVAAVAAMSALATLAEAGIHADRDGLHVMPPEMLQGAVAMQEECKEFLSKTKQFNDIVGDFIDVMESKSKVIEAEKLQAIGLGNRVDHEKEVRKRKQVTYHANCMITQ